MAKSTSTSKSASNKSSGTGKGGKKKAGSSGRSVSARSSNNARSSSSTSGRSSSTSTRSSRNGSAGRSQTIARKSASSANGSSAKGQDQGLMKLFTEQLQDIYYVEKQMMRSLNRMARAANNENLRSALEEHREETEDQMERLEEIFEMLDRNPKGKKCEAMDGLLDEARELMEDFSDDRALDAALVAASQKVEHYEIATYGSLCAWAEQLGLEEAVPLLEETLQEEKQADQKLTELAVSMLNEQAEEDQEMETASAGNTRGSRSR